MGDQWRLFESFAQDVMSKLVHVIEPPSGHPEALHDRRSSVESWASASSSSTASSEYFVGRRAVQKQRTEERRAERKEKRKARAEQKKDGKIRKAEAKRKTREAANLLQEKDGLAIEVADGNYGRLAHSGAVVQDERIRETFAAFDEGRIGETVAFRARVHKIRPIGSKLAFVIFRQQAETLQGVLACKDGVSESMIRWARRTPRETIVLVEGEVESPSCREGIVESTTKRNIEIRVKKIHVVSEVTARMPFNIENASRSTGPGSIDGDRRSISSQTQLENRLLDLRTGTNQAIFRVQSGVCKLAREYLSSHGFLEIHSAKLQQSATESGASVFKVDYFKRSAYLAQSPQLAKEMCIAADMERVFEIGAVYRAENSNTHRHMTEFTGIDLEMAIDRDYHEVLDVLDEMLVHIFKGLQKDWAGDITTVKRQHPHDDFVFLEKTLRLNFTNAIELLREAGWKEVGESGEEQELSEYDDLSTAAERKLGRIVKEKFHTDYYILDKFPLEIRPFYTMPDAANPRLSNSFDIFVRGEEVLSGGQRLHSATEMEKSMMRAGIDPKSMKDYLDGFKWGVPPHGGGGLGLERLVMLFLKLGDIRNASLFPRDPRSFKDNPPFNAKPVVAGGRLKTPSGGIPGYNEPNSISHDPLKQEDHPHLETLIAKYGDSTNTAWTDASYEVWRHQTTGSAIGFIPSSGYAIIWGIPLCETTRLSEVTKSFVEWLGRERNLKPIWLNTNVRTEKVLAEDLDWCALGVAAEQRFDPTEVDFVGDKNMRHKIHQAEREGVKVILVAGNFPPELKAEIDKRLWDWQASRQGIQVHTTALRPWADSEHRTYYVAKDKNNRVCGLVVLAQLSKEHGYQIKWSLAFPDCPNGTSEYITYRAIKAMADVGVRRATFGIGATDKLTAVANVGPFKAKGLERTYSSIVQTFGLTRKTEFRNKFGASEETVYACYPKGGMSLSAVDAILKSVKEPAKKKKVFY